MFRLFLVTILALTAGCGQVAEKPTVAADQAIEPNESRSDDLRIASADGLPIAFTVTGDEPLAVVLIHGWMCDQTYWDAQVPYLAGKYTVVTIDLGGHGESGMERDGWPLQAYAEDVKTVVTHLDLPQVILVGHSMGGPVALETAGLIPDRALGVVGIDTFHSVESKYDPEQMAPFLQALEDDFSTACNGFVRSMFRDGADATLIDRVATDMCSGPPEVGVSLMRQFIDVDMCKLIASTSLPVRSINADLWPTDIASNQKHTADYDAVTVEETGHFLMMEKPETFNPILANVLMYIAHTAK